MFTIEQIKAAHSKVKSGADFPAYIQDLVGLGVRGYETFVTDGNTDYSGAGDLKISSGSKYEKLRIAEESNAAQFISDLRSHQQGNTAYAVFCADCAAAGIEKWVVDMGSMTCTYYDKAGNNILVEQIPAP